MNMKPRITRVRPVRSLAALCAVMALLITLPAAGQSLKDCDVGAYEELRDQTLTPLFEALRAGDVTGIGKYLSARMAEEYKVLFEQNAQYGQFLRDYYAGSSYELLDVRGDEGAFNAVVLIYWSDGRTVETELELSNAEGHLKAEVASGTCADVPE